MIDFARMSIAVATHNRPRYAQAVVGGWAATAPTYREMFLVVNHPDGAAGITLPERCRAIHTGRPPEHAGAMARTWNLAMLWAFRDPETEWLLCSMDDALMLPGWPDMLVQRDADLYLAPAGDLVFLFNRRAFRGVGWFDERFLLIGYQEWDWQARALRALGRDRVSLDDAHGWRINPIGLSQYWRHIGNGAAPTTRREDLQPLLAEWMAEKWGRPPQAVAGELAAGAVGPPRIGEVDWYPWFRRDGA